MIVERTYEKEFNPVVITLTELREYKALQVIVRAYSCSYQENRSHYEGEFARALFTELHCV